MGHKEANQTKNQTGVCLMYPTKMFTNKSHNSFGNFEYLLFLPLSMIDFAAVQV